MRYWFVYSSNVKAWISDYDEVFERTFSIALNFEFHSPETIKLLEKVVVGMKEVKGIS